MKNIDKWHPSKFIYRRGKLIGSRNRNQVQVGSRLMADRVAEFYDNNIRRYAKGRLLDLGSGSVPLFFVYKEFVSESICIDWEKSIHANQYLDFTCDLTKDLPFGNEEFDTIILSDVLEHIPNPEHLWKEMARVLTQQGHILMNVPFFYFIHEEPFDYYRFTEYSLRYLVNSVGLKIIFLESLGGVPEIIADLIAKNIQRFYPIGSFFAANLQFITEKFVKHGIGKRISNRTSKRFPFGYGVVIKKED